MCACMCMHIWQPIHCICSHVYTEEERIQNQVENAERSAGQLCTYITVIFDTLQDHILSFPL